MASAAEAEAKAEADAAAAHTEATRAAAKAATKAAAAQQAATKGAEATAAAAGTAAATGGVARDAAAQSVDSHSNQEQKLREACGDMKELMAENQRLKKQASAWTGRCAWREGREQWRGPILAHWEVKRDAVCRF